MSAMYQVRNVAVRWSAILLRIWKVPGSILDLQTDYPNCDLFVVLLNLYR